MLLKYLNTVLDSETLLFLFNIMTSDIYYKNIQLFSQA